MALWKSWVVLMGLGVLAGQIHTLLGEESQGDKDETALSPAASPSYFDSEPLSEDKALHPLHPLPSSPLEAQQVQEESGLTVLLAICAASFFSVYVIYSLFGRKRERRRGTELRTYSRSVES